MRHLTELVAKLENRGVDLVALQQGIDTRSAAESFRVVSSSSRESRPDAPSERRTRASRLEIVAMLRPRRGCRGRR